jgi:hypothetical protein
LEGDAAEHAKQVYRPVTATPVPGEPPPWLQTLVEALRLLAAPADVQIGLFPAWVAIPDEVAVTFEDAYVVVDKSALSEEAIPMVEQVARRLETLDMPYADRWDPSVLARSEDWRGIRLLAMSALAALGTEYRPPNTSGGRYVRAP